MPPQKSSRQNEVESGPWQTRGRWHRPDGGFMSAEELEAAGLENDPEPPQNFRPPRRDAASEPRRRGRPPRQEPEPQDDSAAEEPKEQEEFTLEELISLFYEHHEQMGLIVEAIESEVERMKGQISLLAQQFSPRQARTAAKANEEESRGRQGQVRSPNDKRLRANRPAPAPEDETAEEEE